MKSRRRDDEKDDADQREQFFSVDEFDLLFCDFSLFSGTFSKVQRVAFSSALPLPYEDDSDDDDNDDDDDDDVNDDVNDDVDDDADEDNHELLRSLTTVGERERE